MAKSKKTTTRKTKQVEPVVYEKQFLSQAELDRIEILELKAEREAMKAKLSSKDFEILNFHIQIKELQKQLLKENINSLGVAKNSAVQVRKDYFKELATKYGLELEAGKWGFNPETGEIAK